MSDDEGAACPVPASSYERIVLAHGAGGRVMQRLIAELFVAAFDSPELRRGHDGAVVDLQPPIAVTTDAFVITPRSFPGGDIGSLAIYGTVNDVAMCGARPRVITAAFVLEEGLLVEELRRIVGSMAAAARRCGVRVVAGDTKVVERGQGDGAYIATTGLGSVLARQPVEPSRVQPGEVVLVSGPVGDHGVAVLAAREGIGIETGLLSDAGPVHEQVLALLEAGVEPSCLRDPTRGGLASALGEVAAVGRHGVRIEEAAVPVRAEVADACELLGLDPLRVACEGRFVAWLPASSAARALEVLRARGCEAAVIGEVVDEHPGVVVLRDAAGGDRVLDMLAGEQLPRIC
ncbi:MAG: hydrogenase expression/formation protein HypE [Myxococcales bacterium]|nr:hydrogenase expression/formation protein HypE [Myxococcales bacterium]